MKKRAREIQIAPSILACNFVELASELADSGVRVIIAGLDLDYLRRPFGPMPRILAIAEYDDTLAAVREEQRGCQSQAGGDVGRVGRPGRLPRVGGRKRLA